MSAVHGSSWRCLHFCPLNFKGVAGGVAKATPIPFKKKINKRQKQLILFTTFNFTVVTLIHYPRIHYQTNRYTLFSSGWAAVKTSSMISGVARL